MQFLTKLKEDPLLSKVLRSSGALFSANTISLGLSMVQSILAGRLLGASVFGLIAIFMSYASTVNGLLSFRMSELVVRYGGEYLEKDEKEKAAALIKAAALGEAAVSLLAFLFVAATATIASQYIAKTPNTEKLFIIYSLGLLANFNAETSTGVLQMLGKIKYQGIINLVQSVITAGMITFAYFTHGTLQLVLYAYLTGKVVLGLGIFFTALFQLTKKLGNGWWHMSLRGAFVATTQSANNEEIASGEVQERPRNDMNFREIFKFAISSNLSATAILAFRESDILWVGYFLTSEAAGYYKAAYGIISLFSVASNPFILTTYPEINKLVTQKAWPRLKNFLKKISSIAVAYNLALAAGFVIFGKWLLSLYGNQYVAAYPVLLALLVGYTFNYILFWNRPLLLSLSLPEFPIYVTLIVGLLKLAFSFPLIPRYGVVAAGALLSFYYIASVGAMVIRGLKEIRQNENRNHH
ncbi:MAG: oligosaccharide flippase family protein [Chloroflexi bacterium]|nr:oligosaccharide flippase family protein [Chloroflexota bacterium]